VTVDAEKMKTATARVVEPTYVLKTEDVPVLLSNMALLREVAARPEEKNREVIQEKTNEIVEETVKDKFDGEKVIQAPTDSEIIDLE
jgi:hypothetical protein